MKFEKEQKRRKIEFQRIQFEFKDQITRIQALISEIHGLNFNNKV